MSEPVDSFDLTTAVGRTIADGRYRIVREIGSGAMGSVYEGVHEALARKVAIKLLHPEMMQRPRYADRFRREARAASLLHHRNSVQLLDFGNDGPFFYLVMEYLAGRTLGAALDAEGPLPPSRAIHIMAQVCAALGAAHDQAIVHRDIKPSNILLTPWIDDDGRPAELVKVLDFGIAKIQSSEDDGPVDRTLTLEGDVCGTPEYMSPEQAEGRRLDHRSDVYACGIVLFQILTGDVPFYGDTPLATMVKQVASKPPPLSVSNPAVSPELEAIVLRCLAKQRDDRFPTVRALRTALLRLAEATPAPGLISEPDLPSVRATDTAATAAGAGFAPTTDERALGLDSGRDATAMTSSVATPATDPLTRVPIASLAPAPVAASGRRRAVWVLAAALLLIAGAAVAWVATSGPVATTGRVVVVDQPGSSPATLAALSAPASPPAAVLAPDTIDSAPDVAVAAIAAAVDVTADSESAVAVADAGPGDDDAPVLVAVDTASAVDDRAEASPAQPIGVVAEARDPDPAPRVVRAERPTRRDPTPRRVDPSAADTLPAPAPTPVDPVAVADAGATAPAVTSAPVVVAPIPDTHTPSPEPNTHTPPPEPVVPPPDPAPVGMDCGIALGAFDSSGSLPRSSIQRALARVEEDVADCYRAGAKAVGHGLAGVVPVTLTIDVDGRARNVTVAPFGLPGVSACVEHAYARVRTLDRPDTGTVRASFSVHFKPRSP